MKVFMMVYNTLDTDARVQRAANALSKIGDIRLFGIDQNVNLNGVKSSVINISSKNNMLRYFEFCHKAKMIIKKNTFDVFYAHDFYMAELAIWVKKKYPKVTLIYDAHELFIPQAGQPWSKRFEYFYRKEKQVVKCADLVIAANKERADIMKTHFNLDKTPTVVRNISFLPHIEDEFAKKILQDTKAFFELQGVTLVYAGLVAASRNIESLIKIVEDNKDSKLMIIGDGNDLSRLKMMGSERLGKRIYFTGGISYVYLSVLLLKCDIGFMNYPVDTLNNIYCAPNKIYEYASVNLPMIANENPTVKVLFEENKIGVASNNLKYAFETVAKNVEEYKNNCSIFCKNNSWDHEKETFLDSIRRVV